MNQKTTQQNFYAQRISNQSNHWLLIFICKGSATKVIIHRRATAVHKSRTRLGFKQHDVILTKE